MLLLCTSVYAATRKIVNTSLFLMECDFGSKLHYARLLMLMQIHNFVNTKTRNLDGDLFYLLSIVTSV